MREKITDHAEARYFLEDVVRSDHALQIRVDSVPSSFCSLINYRILHERLLAARFPSAD